MKVHHITEAPEPKVEPTFNKLPKSVDIKPGILDSKGNKTFSVVDQDGKVIKRFSGPSAEADANTHRDKIKKQIKNAFGSQPRNQIVPGPKADPKPNAPAKPKVDEDGWIKSIWNKIKKSKLGKLLVWLLSRPVATAVIAALNFAQLEDALDAYLRALIAHGKTLDSQEAKKQYLENAKKGRLPQKVAEAYFICQEKWSKLIVEAVVAALVSGVVIGGAGGMLAGLATIIGTGPVGWIIAILTGGALIWGGTTLVGKILDAIGLNDIVEDYVVQPILSPNAMLSTGVAVDSFQEIIGILLDTGDAAPYIGGLVPSGDLVRDSIELDEGYVLISEGKTIPSKGEIKSNLKALMKAEPKLVKAFNKGKEQGKAAVNDLI